MDLLKVTWRNPHARSEGEKKPFIQKLKLFSCMPIVIIPTNTVPIDFAMFLVSPFHKKFERVKKDIPVEAQEGLDYHEDEVEDGVEVVHHAEKPGLAFMS